jgi:hypothetical protein
MAGCNPECCMTRRFLFQNLCFQRSRYSLTMSGTRLNDLRSEAFRGMRPSFALSQDLWDQ